MQKILGEVGLILRNGKKNQDCFKKWVMGLLSKGGLQTGFYGNVLCYEVYHIIKFCWEEREEVNNPTIIN